MDQIPIPDESINWPECCGELMDDFANECVCATCGNKYKYEPDNIEPVDLSQD